MQIKGRIPQIKYNYTEKENCQKVSTCDHSSRVDLLFCYIPQIRKANSQGEKDIIKPKQHRRDSSKAICHFLLKTCVRVLVNKMRFDAPLMWMMCINILLQILRALFFTHHVYHRVTSHPYCPKLVVRIVESGEKRTEVPLHHASFFVICFLCLFSGKYLWQLWFLCPGKTRENYLAWIVC